MKLLYSALLVALPSLLFAQTNYHDGYVVKNNGDTLKGYIDYREWVQCPKSIDFKMNKDDKPILQFEPKNIRKFQITGLETYITYSGLISKNSTRFPYLEDVLDTSKKASTIFLKQVTTGKYLTLYYYEDDVKSYYFIAETNGQPVELNYYEYYKYSNDEKRVAYAEVYKSQLFLYINKYSPGKSTLIRMVDNAKYEQNDLKQLIDEINDNRAIANKNSPSARFFAGIRINNTSTQYSQDFDLVTTVSKTTTTISPQINLGMDIFNNGNIQRLVLRGEASLSYINPKFIFPLKIVDQNTTAVYSFDQYTATITPQILLNIYNKENLKIYLDIGAGLNFSAYANNKLNVVGNGLSFTTVAPKLESIWFNFPIQAGVTLNNKIELALTYFGYATYTNNANYDVRNSSVGLGIKYLFNGR